MTPKTARLPRILAGFLGLAALTISLATQAETLRVGGTGAALGTLRQIGAEFSRQNPSIRIEVLPYVGSTGAIKAVDAGSLDLGLSGRPAKPDEDRLDARLSAYARTPMVIAAHPSNALQSISRDQLSALYGGRTREWGDGGRIRIILRPAHETDNDVLRLISPEISLALDQALKRPGMMVAYTDQDAADAIESTPGAIGTSTLALLRAENRKVRILALDGIAPDVQTLANGSYPFGKTLYLVTRRHPVPAVEALTRFIRSPQGRQIQLTNGQLPVDP